MLRASALAVCVVVAVACAVSCGPGLGGPPSSSLPPPTSGEPYSVQCAACHGDNGEGLADAPQIQNPIDAYARFVVRNGHDVMGFDQEMPAFSVDVVSDADLDGIIVFLQSAPKPTTGAGLYDRMCLNCHGGVGDGGGRVDEDVFGEDASDVEEVVREGHHASRVSDREYMPAFSETDLTDAEVALLATFLGGGAEEEEDDEEEDD